MKLPSEGARWLVSLRWLACVSVFVVAWLSSSVLGVIGQPMPLFVIGGVMVVYNLLFQLSLRDWVAGEASMDRHIFLQIATDLIALTLLLYFSDMARNPFLLFFVFHMIIASMYLHGWIPYVVAGMATVLMGGVILAEHMGWIVSFPMNVVTDPPDGLYLLAVFVALASTLWITVYFTTSIHRYADRAQAQLRQREKMLGIGQLVAGIAHQIANPLDGLQNCLHIIGEGVKGDSRLTEYVKMMGEALERIERTANRVQVFAQPRGISLERTDVNAAVESTLALLGRQHGENILIETDLRDVPHVQGDRYTLQEVLFNLCSNALAAMPQGGTLTIRTRVRGRSEEEDSGAVAIEVIDTGVGIPRPQLDKIFQPFFTTKADAGGTGLGLSLCRMLVSEMGGQIDVKSTVGHRTTFTVSMEPDVSVSKVTAS